MNIRIPLSCSAVFIFGFAPLSQAQKLKVTEFFPLTPDTVWQLEGPGTIKGPLLDIEVNTTASASATLWGVVQNREIINVKGTIESDTFTLPLYGQTKLTGSFEILWSGDEDGIRVYGASTSYSLGPYADSTMYLADSPIVVMPALVEVGERFDYAGWGNSGAFRVSGTYHITEIGHGSLQIGDLEAIRVVQSSPYDPVTLVYWLTRDVELVQFEMHASEAGNEMSAVVTTRSLNRPYRIRPIFNVWDSLSVVASSNVKLDPIMGALSDSHYPHVYTNRAGWLYHATHDRQQALIYSHDDGWLWANLDALPHVWHFGRQEWVRLF